VLVTYGKKVVFLDPNTLEKTRPGWEVADEILDAKYLPGARAIFVGRRDSVAQLLDVATGAPISPPMTHAHAVTSVAVSPDGKVLLTGSRDNTAQFWDVATGLPLGPPMRHAGPVTHVGYSPKGDFVVTGTGTGDVLTWSTPPQPLAGTLDELRARVKKGKE
jgi:WD40 repeat protein